MTDGRKRRRDKQRRRDVRRRERRRKRVPEPAGLFGNSLADLLLFVSSLIARSEPHPLADLQFDDEPIDLTALVSSLIDSPEPRCLPLLAILGELLADGTELRERCRHCVDERRNTLPQCLSELGSATVVHRAARVTCVLGDFEHLILGVRLSNAEEVTCVVRINHLLFSGVDEVAVLDGCFDTAVAEFTEKNTNPDLAVVHVDVADAKALLQFAIDAFIAMPSETWPRHRALLQWLSRLMPEGGVDPNAHHRNWRRTKEILDRFFASPDGKPFDFFDERELLEEALGEETADPLRWSATRIRRLLSDVVSYHDHADTAAHLAVPAMLGAYVRFAHAECGIRQELTDRAVAAIHAMTTHYRAEVYRWTGWIDDDNAVGR